MNTANAYDSGEARWAAVISRDRRADGVFLYAVKTTGVYCRPVCPSRTPKRDNVEFFRSRGQAERQGFRACKKCRPGSTASNQIPDAVVRACNLIDDAEESPSLEVMARAVGLSLSYFHRLFKKTVGVTRCSGWKHSNLCRNRAAYRQTHRGPCGRRRVRGK